MKILSLLYVVFLCFYSHTQINAQVKGPIKYVYDTTKSTELKAYVFYPPGDTLKQKNPAIVIFHGGGWHIGDASWAFGRANHFASKGMVAVAAQYRLSDQKNITPLDAMEDARNIILWMRDNADMLNISSNSIVAYGWSAGAHLAACAAIFDSLSPESNHTSVPNALVLISPGLSIVNDRWLEQILLNKARPINISPAEHIKPGIPPSIILIGRTDSVTPLAGSQLFYDNMLKHGNICSLIIYENVGHLFTPSDEPDDGMPNPDKEVQEKAYQEIDQFLISLGYIK